MKRLAVSIPACTLVLACIPSIALAEFTEKFTIHGNLPAIVLSDNPPCQSIVDLNGDSYPEIIVMTNQNRTLELFSGVGIFLFSKVLEGSVIHMEIADVDHDDMPDILVQYDLYNEDGITAIGWQGPPVLVDDPTPASQVRLRLTPNPASGGASFDVVTSQGGQLKVEIFDVTGRRIRTLEAAIPKAGSYPIQWDGYDAAGNELPSGDYYYRLSLNGELVDTGKSVQIH